MAASSLFLPSSSLLSSPVTSLTGTPSRKNTSSERRNEELQAEIIRLKDTTAEITTENLELKKRLEAHDNKTSLFYDIHKTVEKTSERSGFPISRILRILGISKAWYYRHLDPTPIIDRRFNPFSISTEELAVLSYRNKHPKMNFRLLAYSMIDRDIAYLSPSEVYKILKKYDLITPWKRQLWAQSRPERSKHPDERWQVDIMYLKVKERFFC